MAGRLLQDCLFPSHFYELMESELKKEPKLTRENFLTTFVVNLIRNALNCKPEGTRWVNSEVINANPTEETWSNSIGEESEFEGSYFLSKEQKLLVERILIFATHAKSIRGFGFDLSQFASRFSIDVEFPCLELLWLLETKYKLMSISAYLMKVKSEYPIEYFSNQFVTFCFSSCFHEDATSAQATQMLNDILHRILISAYCNNEVKLSLNKLRTSSIGILAKISEKLCCEEVQQSSFHHRFLTEVLQGVPIMTSVKKRYFSSQLLCLLHQPSDHNLANILQLQETFAANDLEKQRKQDTISMFIGPPHTKHDVVEVLRKCLKHLGKVNWENLLHTITVWERIYSDVSFEIFRLMKDLIRALLSIGLNQEKEDEIKAAFVLARHCCLISPQNFSRYEKWFASMFEHEHSAARTPPKFIFLTSALSNWVPTEPPSFLQVHVSYRPFIPTGCREIWNDYCSLAKARIIEYNEVEEAMEYEPNPNNPVQYDVEMAIKSYDKSKKIPQTIMEMILLRKQYYLGHFLPTLVKKPSGTLVSDARLRLIEALNVEKKIPKYFYDTYKTNFQQS